MSQAGILGFFVGIRARAWGSEKTNLLHFHFIEKNTDSLKNTDLGLEDHVKKNRSPKTITEKLIPSKITKKYMLEDHEKIYARRSRKKNKTEKGSKVGDIFSFQNNDSNI
jgi:hypothetical protein